MNNEFRVYISADMEGVAGISSPSDVWEQGKDHDEACTLLVGEINAAVRACFEMGISTVLVNDSHMYMRNISRLKLDPRVRLIRGSDKLGYMMEGVENKEYSLGLFIGYHSMAGTKDGVLSHTFSGQWASLHIGNETVGETSYNAAYAGRYGCKIGMVSGDASLRYELEKVLPWAEHAIVKDGIGRFSANSLSPVTSQELIFEKTTSAINKYMNNLLELYTYDFPQTVQLEFYFPDRAYKALFIPGVKQVSSLRVEFEVSDFATLNQYLRTLMMVTQ